MYIDFEEQRPETPRVERALSVREGVLISIIVHLLLLIALLVVPKYLPESPPPRAVAVIPERPADTTRFVFVEPRVDVPRPQPRVDVDASDQDRVLSTLERPPNPRNERPFARGNTRLPEIAAPSPPAPTPPAEPAVAQGNPNANEEGQFAANDPSKSLLNLPERPDSSPALRLGGGAPRGRLGDALRNIDRYVQHQSFDNEMGSGDAQGLIQFDSKGVDFGPWLRRFVAQVKRNWFVPQAAMILRGHVVITFNIHRNGAITDIQVRKPSQVESFNQAAVNALMASNPTQPLPAEYPTDSVLFTVTFLYNEDPADFR